MRQTRVLGLQVVPFGGIEFERVKLANLPLELLALRRKCRRIGLDRGELPRGVLPAAPGIRHRIRFGAQSGIRVEQRALCRTPHQRLVFMLAVNVDQMLARLTQLRERCGTAVDERA